jgi:hypothetical protein
MSPGEGKLQKVVLLTEAFGDDTVEALAQLANLQALFADLKEIRLVETAITANAVRRLKSLLPNVTINIVTHEQWKSNVQTSNPNFDLESGKLDEPVPDQAARSASLARFKRLFKERYGRDWPL